MAADETERLISANVCLCEHLFTNGHVFLVKSCNNSCRGVQHHWHTARDETIANGGKESGTLDFVLGRSLAWVT